MDGRSIPPSKNLSIVLVLPELYTYPAPQECIVMCFIFILYLLELKQLTFEDISVWFWFDM